MIWVLFAAPLGPVLLVSPREIAESYCAVVELSPLTIPTSVTEAAFAPVPVEWI